MVVARLANNGVAIVTSICYFDTIVMVAVSYNRSNEIVGVRNHLTVNFPNIFKACAIRVLIHGKIPGGRISITNTIARIKKIDCCNFILPIAVIPKTRNCFCRTKCRVTIVASISHFYADVISAILCNVFMHHKSSSCRNAIYGPTIFKTRGVKLK